MVSVLFALLTALFNGLASVLQRMAAATAPASKALHLSLFGYLIKRKVWLAGIGMVMLAAVCQATALATGPVALVQPIFIIELPFTLLVASRLAHRKLPPTTWGAVGLVTVALGAGLAAAAPSGGGTDASPKVWAAALIATGIFQAVVITVGVRTRGNARAAAFGLAAACGYALTATLLKSAVSALDRGIGPFFSSWQLYATAVAGVGALFLLQNALQAGSLVAVQPPLTLGDALISVAYGVTVFGENVNTGGWLLVIEIVAVIAIAIGCIELSRSLALVHVVQPAELPGWVSAEVHTRGEAVEQGLEAVFELAGQGGFCHRGSSGFRGLGAFRVDRAQLREIPGLELRDAVRDRGGDDGRVGRGCPGAGQGLDGVQGVAGHVVVDGGDELEPGRDGEPGAGHCGEVTAYPKWRRSRSSSGRRSTHG